MPKKTKSVTDDVASSIEEFDINKVSLTTENEYDEVFQKWNQMFIDMSDQIQKIDDDRDKVLDILETIHKRYKEQYNDNDLSDDNEVDLDPKPKKKGRAKKDTSKKDTSKKDTSTKDSTEDTPKPKKSGGKVKVSKKESKKVDADDDLDELDIELDEEPKAKPAAKKRRTKKTTTETEEPEPAPKKKSRRKKAT